jgi:hypothetical protein
MRDKHNAKDTSVQVKQDEMLLVEYSNTVGNPWTMVVHSDHASFALFAVVCSWRFHAIAKHTSFK